MASAIWGNERPAILCVDDEAAVLEAARTQLREKFGAEFDIEVATNGAEALEIVDELMEDGIALPVVLSDEIMPEMRGHEFLGELHRRSPDTKNILMTGQAGLDAVTQAVNHASLFQYIAKPWSKVDLLLTVERAIESYAAVIERQHRLKAFYRFVPADLIRALGESDPANIELGVSAKREMVVMFSDIRGFSTMAEHAGPEHVLASVNMLFERMIPIINAHGGTIDKFIGDAVMAVFPEVDRAVVAAVEIHRDVDRMESLIGPIRVGVGLHWGGVVMGTVGDETRLQTTVLGDVVNSAARIEGMTRDLGAAILMSEEVAERSGQASRYVGSYRLKGRRGLVPLHQPLGHLPDAIRERLREHDDDFKRVVHSIDHSDPISLDEIERYRELVPEDRVASALATVLRRRSTMHI